MNNSVHFDAIPCIIANVIKEHVFEDDIMFTKVLALQGLTLGAGLEIDRRHRCNFHFIKC